MLRANTRALVAVFALLAIFTQSTNGLQSGVYNIQLADAPFCQYQISGLAFNNRTCASEVTGNQEPARPFLRSATSGARWQEWKLDVKHGFADGSYLVSISTAWNSRYGSIKRVLKLTSAMHINVPCRRCPGKLATESDSACASGDLAPKVVVDKTTQLWHLVPASGNTFYIAVDDRDSKCLRYLGALKDCSTTVNQLFKKGDEDAALKWDFVRIDDSNDNGSGNTNNPSPPPSPTNENNDKAPGAPVGLNTVYQNLDKWFVTWYDGTAGTPTETYIIKCVDSLLVPRNNCTAVYEAPAIGDEVDKLPRGTEQGLVVGLVEGKNPNCYVIAINRVGYACSAPVEVQTESASPSPPPPAIVPTLCPPELIEAAFDGVFDRVNEYGIVITVNGQVGTGPLTPPSPLTVCKTNVNYYLVCAKKGESPCSSGNIYGSSDPASFDAASAPGGAALSLETSRIPFEEMIGATGYVGDAYAVAEADGERLCSATYVMIENVCFPASATVQVLGRGTVRMDELNVGDKVLAATKAGKLEWSEVFFFGRRQANVTAQYHKLTAKSSDGTLGELKMSSIHFVAATADDNGWCSGKSKPPVWSSHKMMLAKDVKPGMVLWQSSTQDLSSSVTPSCVIANELVMEEGAYDPFIRDRALIVDSFAASPHVRWTALGLYWLLPTWMQPHLPAIYDVFMTPVYWFYKVMGAEFINNLTQTYFFTGYLADQPLCRGGAFYCIGGNVMLASYISLAAAALFIVRNYFNSSIGISKLKKN